MSDAEKSDDLAALPLERLLARLDQARAGGRIAAMARIEEEIVTRGVRLPPLPDHGNAREVLPDRRSGGALDFTFGAIQGAFTVGWSCFPAAPGRADWRCAEIFLSHAKADGDLEKNVRDAGILASFALQHGAPLDALVAGVTHESDGQAASIIGTALALVKSEIERLKPIPDGAEASAPEGKGDGGGAGTAAVPAHAIQEVIDECLRMIFAERRRQVSVERFSHEHDDAHRGGQLIFAAGCYLRHGTDLEEANNAAGVPRAWPWEGAWWKPKGRVRDLVRAGALCVADDERFRRLGRPKGSPAARRMLSQVVIDLALHGMKKGLAIDRHSIDALIGTKLAPQGAEQTIDGTADPRARDLPRQGRGDAAPPPAVESLDATDPERSLVAKPSMTGSAPSADRDESPRGAP